jgi:ATP-dependent RNA helicase UAP56/SUB2
LVDYEEVDEVQNQQRVGTKKGASYSGISSSAFKDFLLKPEINRALIDAAFEHPSEIQQEAIPSAIMGMDLVCQAKSGMGKTAVFVLTTLHQLEPEKGVVSVLVLCHTRELAFQIHGEYTRFSKYFKDVKAEVFFGGSPVAEHLAMLKNPDTVPNIVIGTTGRILDLAKRGALKLDKIKHFVIDECDSVLGNLSMRQDSQQIFQLTPHGKQVMLFSATLPPDVRPVCKLFTKDPLEIFVDDEQKLRLDGLTQYVITLKEAEKNRKLCSLLDALSFNQVIIFVSKHERASELCRLLVESNFPSLFMHARMKQAERMIEFEKFKKCQARIMVSTDLMGRGIDCGSVNVTINYSKSYDYLHRVNRAGRFGTKGLAISFISSPADEEILAQVEARFGNKIPILPDEVDPSTYTNA